MDELLTTSTVGDYLCSRGVVPKGTPVDAVDLEWGVSNVVLAVRTPSLRAVVKQALPKLRVADEWLAKRERTVTEGEALRLAARLTPDAVPTVIDCDPDSCTLVVAHAPDGWRNWKEILLSGTFDARVAARAGEVLGTWHSRTSGDTEVAGRFNDLEAFDQLRVDPYHKTVMARRSEMAAKVGEYVERMAATQRCLVHGDYSPKNLLIGDDANLWVVDFEVAHYGDPAFDVAFMLNHLLLKAIHTGGDLRPLLRGFWDGYHRLANAGEPSYVLGQTGCLMLARVDGKSPAEYLSDEERTRARTLGDSLVTEPPGGVDEIWERM